MKKILSLFIIVIIILSFSSCENNSMVSNSSNPVSTKNQETIVDNSSAETPIKNPINFDDLQSKNPDICAWIKIPTIDVIDYPIVQATDHINSIFYCSYDYYGNKAKEGAIFIQQYNRNTFDDSNTVIYGNYMNNGTMFGQLHKFLDETFFAENRTIYVYTPKHILEYEIVSAFVYDNRHILKTTETQNFFNECLNPLSNEKQVTNDATLDANKDKIITLSTLTENDYERLLVIGKLIKDTKTE